MAETICVAQQKGGTGKTTTAVNLGCYLAALGRKVLLVDLDPQANLSTHVGFDKQSLQGTIYDVILGNRSLDDVIVQTEVEGLDVAPSNVNLAGAAIELASMEKREYVLADALATVQDQYDYIIIDTPPSLGLLTVNGVVASNSMIIPIQAQYYALEGISQLLQVIELTRDALNTLTEIKGVLLTMFDQRTNLSREVLDQVQEYFKGKVFKTMIPINVRLAEAPSHGQPIMLYDRNCSGAKAYASLAHEIIAMEPSS